MNINVTSKRQIASVRQSLDNTSNLCYWNGDLSGRGKGKTTIVEQIECERCDGACCGPNPVTIKASPVLTLDVLNDLGLTYRAEQRLPGPLPEYGGFDDDGALLCQACYEADLEDTDLAEGQDTEPTPEPAPEPVAPVPTSHIIRTRLVTAHGDVNGWLVVAEALTVPDAPGKPQQTTRIEMLTSDPDTTLEHVALAEHQRAADALAMILRLDGKTRTTSRDFSAKGDDVSGLRRGRFHVYS